MRVAANWHQIDLDGTDDDIRDIQQEISLLSTCASPFVTQYITSFVRGTKLWIVMEYLGGGSCLDLVSNQALRSVKIDKYRSKSRPLTNPTLLSCVENYSLV